MSDFKWFVNFYYISNNRDSMFHEYLMILKNYKIKLREIIENTKESKSIKTAKGRFVLENQSIS